MDLFRLIMTEESEALSLAKEGFNNLEKSNYSKEIKTNFLN
jgi:hypothetical protein